MRAIFMLLAVTALAVAQPLTNDADVAAPINGRELAYADAVDEQGSAFIKPGPRKSPGQTWNPGRKLPIPQRKKPAKSAAGAAANDGGDAGTPGAGDAAA